MANERRLLDALDPADAAQMETILKAWLMRVDTSSSSERSSRTASSSAARPARAR
jgi:hypothetical protein